MKKSGVVLFILGIILVFCGAGLTIFDDFSENKKLNNDNIEEKKDSNEVEDENIDSDIIDDFYEFTDDTTSGKYNGTMWFNPMSKIKDIFNIDVPSQFEDVFVGNGVDKKLITNTSGTFNYCRVSFKEVKNYTSSKQLAEEMAEYFSAFDSLTQKEINGIRWQYFYYPNIIGNSDYYLTDLDNKVFIFEYEIGSDADVNVCEPYRNSIINSISYK